MAPQLAHLATVLHLSVTESVGTALAYHRILGAKLQEKARKRTTLTAEFAALLASENFTIKEQAKKEIAIAIDADHRARDRDPKAKGRGKRGIIPLAETARYDVTQLPTRRTSKLCPTRLTSNPSTTYHTMLLLTKTTTPSPNTTAVLKITTVLQTASTINSYNTVLETATSNSTKGMGGARMS